MNNRSLQWRVGTEDVREAVCGLLFVAAMAFLAWAYCKVTPDQLSGEADRHYQACEDAGVEYAPAYGKEVR